MYKALKKNKPFVVLAVMIIALLTCVFGVTSATAAETETAADGMTVTLAAGETATVYAENSMGPIEISQWKQYVDLDAITSLSFNVTTGGSWVADFRYAGADTTEDTADDKYLALYVENGTDYYFMVKGNSEAKVCTDLSYFNVSGKTTIKKVDFTNFEIAELTRGEEANFGYFFAGCTSLEEVIFPKAFVIGKAGIARMFDGCASLTSVTFDSWEITPSNTNYNISGMFSGCTNLEEVDFVNCKDITTAVSYLKDMFNGCTNLKTADLSIFRPYPDASDHSNAFTGCTALETIYLPRNTQNNQTITGITLPSTFYNALGNSYTNTLPKANMTNGVVAIYKADTTPVAYMKEVGSAYSFAASLPNLAKSTEYIYINGKLPDGYTFIDEKGTISNGTTTVTPTLDMRADTDEIKSILPVYLYYVDDIVYIINGGAVNGYVTATSGRELFCADYLNNYVHGFVNVKEIYLSHLDTSEVETASKMFHGMEQLTKIEFGDKFDTSNMKNMGMMFHHLPGLKELDLSSFNTSNVTSMSSMFGESGLETLDIRNFDTSSVTTFDNMFKGISSNILIGDGFTTAACTSFERMFQDYIVTESNCVNFQNIINRLDFSGIIEAEEKYQKFVPSLFWRLNLSQAPDDFVIDISNLDIATAVKYYSNDNWTSLDYVNNLFFNGYDADNGTVTDLDVKAIKVSQDGAKIFNRLGVSEAPIGWTRTDDNAYFANKAAIVDAGEAGTYEWHEHSYNNGFCSCGGYEEAYQNDEGYYQITNGGNLFWFAELVNGGTYGVNAIITADVIDLESRNFPGIGGYSQGTGFSGTFDGNNKTIVNFAKTVTQANSGLFNVIYNATVKNFTISGEISVEKDWTHDVGSAVGQMYISTVEGINSSVDIIVKEGITLTKTPGTGVPHVGGIVGAMYGNSEGSPCVVKNCIYTGTINARQSYDTIGGIVGYAGQYAAESIENCAFYGTIISEGTYRLEGTYNNFIGGILGYVNRDSFVISNCISAGTIEFTPYTTFSQPYHIADIVHYQATSVNCYVENCYYVDNDATQAAVTTRDGNTVLESNLAACKEVTKDQIDSGEATWLLNRGAEDGNQAWYQTIGATQPLPFKGDTVYKYITGGCAENVYTYVYTNVEGVDIIDQHDYEVGDGNNGFCNVCGGYQAPELINDIYQIKNGGNLFWFAELVNGGEYNANALLTCDIDLEGREFMGIGEPTVTTDVNNGFSGLFQGDGYTINNLYMRVDEHENVGLFNLTNRASIICFTVKGTIEVVNAKNHVGGVVGQATVNTVVGYVHSYVDIKLASNAAAGQATYYGGVIGFVKENTNILVEKCTYHGEINTGDIVDTVGGIVGHGGYIAVSTYPDISNRYFDCAFYGKIISNRSGTHSGGIIGYANGRAKISNCLVAGTISSTASDAKITAFGVHNNAVMELDNSYYLETSAQNIVLTDGNADLSNHTATKISAEQLESGEIAWLLDGGETGGREVWKQIINTDAYPYPDLYSEYVVYRHQTGGCCEKTWTYAYANEVIEDVTTHGELFYDAERNSVICPDCEQKLSAYIDINVFDYDWVEIDEETTICVGTYIDAPAIYINGARPDGWEDMVPVDITAEGSDIKVHLYRDSVGNVYVVNAAFAEAPVKVTTAADMFIYHNATYIDLTKVDFSECVSMSYMFYDCELLETIVFNENIDTSSCTDMSSMFGITSSLTNIVGLNFFDTENVVNMGEMFRYADSLVKLDLSSFNTKNVTNMDTMFASSSLESITVGDNFTTENVTSMIDMFYLTYSLQWDGVEDLIKQLDTSKVTDMSRMFHASALTYLDLSHFKTDALEIADSMFEDAFNVNGVTLVLPYDLLSKLTNSGLLSEHPFSREYNPYYFYGWDVKGSYDEESTHYYGTEFNTLATTSGEVYTLMSHTHVDGGLYYVESSESDSITVYCSCGEIFDVFTIELYDTELSYTGSPLEVTPEYSSLYDSDASVEWLIYYYDEEIEDYVEVDEVINAGSYKVVMAMGSSVSTFALTDATGYATAEKEFYVNGISLPVIFIDHDGSIISEEYYELDGENNSDRISPIGHSIPNSVYYTYTFKHWVSNEFPEVFTSTDNLPTLQELYDSGYREFTFQAVYNVNYNKEFHLVGSIDEEKTELSTSGIYADENVIIVSGDEAVTVYANYAIQTNGGIAALLLIPEYESAYFTITAVSINGVRVHGDTDVTSNALLTGWETTVTKGTDAPFKILLEYLAEGSPVNTATGELFIQIEYTMANAVSGEYDFGFVTEYQDDTFDNSTDGELSHNNRSEAYGVITSSPLASFNELKINVDAANIIIVKRTDTTIEMTTSSVVYDAAAAEIYEDSKLNDDITNVLVYHYGGCETTLADGSAHDWTQYITITWYSDANGESVISAPTNVGTYYVGISAIENDYFNAIDEEIFTVTITPYTIDVSAIKKNDKTYNGGEQTWTESDFTITNDTPALGDDAGYSLEITNATWTNANSYDVTLTFTADSNYTFTENGTIDDAADTKVIEINVTMHKFALTITADNKTSQYTDALAELTYTLTATNAGEDAAFAESDTDDLTISLSTDATNEAPVGAYDITIEATSLNDNYDITLIHKQDNGYAENGTYTITRKQITAPTIADLIYNGTEQFPTESEAAYGYTGDQQTNVGTYDLTATLVDANYVWADYASTTDADTLYRTIEWKIAPAPLTVNIATVTDNYGKNEADALATVLGSTTATGLMEVDNLGDLIVLSFSTTEDFVDDAGFVMPNEEGYVITGVASDASGNYTITIIDGKYIVNPVALGPQLKEIIANIESTIKEYNGKEQTWTEEEFTLTSTLENGEEIKNVLEITVVAKKTDDYVNANGILGEGDVWTYHDPETKLYYTVTIKVIDERQGAYSFGASEDDGIIYEQNVDVEVFIKQATNQWNPTPSVDATNIEVFDATAGALFTATDEVSIVITDADGQAVTKDDLQAGNSYTATFTVKETKNYTGLSETIEFELGFAKVNIPTVYLDSTDGKTVPINSYVEITYDGLTHELIVVPSADGKYTVTVWGVGKDASEKEGYADYWIEVEPTGNYQWDHTTYVQDALVYQIVIKKASLTITAVDKTVTYRDEAPAYTTTEDEFVNGETYETYQPGFDITDYIVCEYVQNANVGTYGITFDTNAEAAIEGILKNYDVTLVAGTLTVNKLELDLSDLKGQLDTETAQAWTTLVTNGLSVEYNAADHKVTVSEYPPELIPTITYDGEATLPKNAGDYTVSVEFSINSADGYDANNFTWTNPATVKLSITKVAITVTASEQTTPYTGKVIVASALTADEKTMTWKYTGEKGEDEIDFITDVDLFELTGLALNGEYSAVGNYDEAITVEYSFAEGVADNYTITFEDGMLIIAKEDLTWEIQLDTTNRVYNGAAIKAGEGAVDYYATLDATADRQYLTYKIYDSNTEDAVALTAAPANAGTYYVKAFYNDTIHNEISTDYKEIVISKATVTISGVEDITKNYLQDYDVTPTATKPTLEVEDNYVPSVTVEYYNGDSRLDSKPLTVGSYTIKVTVNNVTNNYEAESVTKTLTINKATLSQVEFVYSLDTATWEAITTTTDGELINKYGAETVIYTVGEQVIDDYKFTATATGVYTLVASIEGNNFISSESEMLEVFSVTFADSTLNHDRTPDEDATAYVQGTKAAAMQYRFNGQAATQPNFAGEGEEVPTITGHTFKDAWNVVAGSNDAYVFTNGVTQNVTLYAMWNRNQYVVGWYNDTELIYSMVYEYKDVPEYGKDADGNTYSNPEKAATAEWIYTFSGWGTAIDGEVLENLPQVTDNAQYYAVYSHKGVTYTVTFMLSTDGKTYAEEYIELLKIDAQFGDDLTTLCPLDPVTWFRSDVWYAQAERWTKVQTVPVGGATVYGSYVFDVGNGDVNADGQITTADITLYRQLIVGGYDITVVRIGTEWDIVNSDNFDKDAKYFIERVSDVNADTSADIRDVTTIRMSIVGGYGYQISEGLEKAKVTGKAVTIAMPELTYETISEHESTTVVDNNTIIIDFEKIEQDYYSSLANFFAYNVNVDNASIEYAMYYPDGSEMPNWDAFFMNEGYYVVGGYGYDGDKDAVGIELNIHNRAACVNGTYVLRMRIIDKSGYVYDWQNYSVIVINNVINNNPITYEVVTDRTPYVTAIDDRNITITLDAVGGSEEYVDLVEIHFAGMPELDENGEEIDYNMIGGIPEDGGEGVEIESAYNLVFESDNEDDRFIHWIGFQARYSDEGEYLGWGILLTATEEAIKAIPSSSVTVTLVMDFDGSGDVYQPIEFTLNFVIG